MRKYVFAALACAAALSFCSCSESNNDSDYQSRLPQYSDVSFSPTPVKAGQTVTATAVEHRRGRLLGRTTYTWTVESVADSLLTQNYRTVVYSQQSGSPSVTYQAPSRAGRYTITMTAHYNISGQAHSTNESADIPSGSVSYQMSALTGQVVVRKTYTVGN